MIFVSVDVAGFFHIYSFIPTFIYCTEDGPHESSNKYNNPIIFYSNGDTHKLQILTDNKGKSGIYLWTHLESDKNYVGSALDFSI
jgi:hypothetical protein